MTADDRPPAGQLPEGTAHRGPLRGIKVLEFTMIWSGPYAGIHLTDMGADTLKVEPLEGDQLRLSRAVVPGHSKSFQWMNRGKKSIAINLQDERGQEIVRRLVPEMDVVLVNFRHGVPKRLGIDYETLAEINPRLVYADITAFGSDGPLAQYAASDIVGQGQGGSIAVAGQLAEDGAPLYRNVPLADLGSGLVMAMGICAALLHRERTGEGQYITTSLLRTVMGLNNMSVMREPVSDAPARDMLVQELDRVRAAGGSYDALIETRNDFGPRTAQQSLYFRGYRASDGGLVIGALTRANRDAIRRAIGIEGDPSDDEDFDPADPKNDEIFDRLKEVVQAKLLTKTVDEWLELLRAEGAPAGKVSIPEELSDDPQGTLHMQELVHDVTGPQRQVRPMVDMRRSETGIAGPAPALGGDTDAALDRVGYTEAEIAQLRAEGVVA